MQCRRRGFNSWVGKIPQRRAWQSTPVFLPEESPWTEEPGMDRGATVHGAAESDMTDSAYTYTYIQNYIIMSPPIDLMGYVK